MTLEQVTETVEAIRLEHNDPEAAHRDEDDLRRAVLLAIAEMRDPRKMRALAREALKTGGIDFPRWCS